MTFLCNPKIVYSSDNPLWVASSHIVEMTDTLYSLAEETYGIPKQQLAEHYIPVSFIFDVLAGHLTAGTTRTCGIEVMFLCPYEDSKLSEALLTEQLKVFITAGQTAINKALALTKEISYGALDISVAVCSEGTHKVLGVINPDRAKEDDVQDLVHDTRVALYNAYNELLSRYYD